YIMTALRTIEGISLQYIQANFGEDEKQNLLQRAIVYINNQSIQLNNDCLQLTNAAKFLADGIAADLFV
ncbi:MAG: coproporphyrinogen III oxidase, partial [Chitinophagaceae bacterium]|nr:coproporphyrinogen III oxidase [Chitinophagaceae bacterium]